MSNCNQCGNCSQCAPTVQLTSPPTCPTTACEEYISSNCVTNEVTAACSSVFTDPRDGEIIPVGYSISSGSTMTEVISALTAPSNCLFSENYLGAALQYIGNNTVLTSILCNIIQDCISGCLVEVVSTLSFDPVVVTDDGTAQDAYWTTNFLPHLGLNSQPDYDYKITITDTNTTPPNVWTITLTPAMQLALLNTNPPGDDYIHFNFNIPAYALTLESGVGPATTNLLPSGHTYETVITSEYLGQECDSDSFTLVVPESPLCPDCEYDIAFELCEDIPAGNICLDITAEVGGLPSAPYGYTITLTNNTTATIVTSGSYLTEGDNPFNYQITDLTGTDYTVTVVPVCSFDPLYCTGTPASIDVTVDPPAVCAPPDITNVTVTP
jgi:hypothetical protein